jgi:hypothetical protein
MSNQNFPQAAVDRLILQVHDPVFFQKLATDWNINPQTAEEQGQLLELAVILRDAYDNEQIKTAYTGNSFLADAIDNLKIALTDRGYPTLPTSEEQQIKQAAAQAVCQDAELQNAALEYAQFLSEQVS